MAFRGKILYAISFTSLYRLSLRTGASHSTAVGMFGHGLGSSGDLAFANGHLHATVTRPGSNLSYLAAVNIRTGAARIIGTTGHHQVFGLVTSH